MWRIFLIRDTVGLILMTHSETILVLDQNIASL